MKRVGGRLCLDFTNTVSEWRLGEGNFEPEGDHLQTYADFLTWSAAEVEAGDRRRAAEPLRRIRALRAALYRLFRRHAEGMAPSAEDLDTLNTEWQRARATERVEARGGNFAVAAPDRPLAAVVRSAVELLTSPDLARVKFCPGEHCGWLFLDTSKSGRRRWCDMSDCGNLDKVRRFRERRTQIK